MFFGTGFELFVVIFWITTMKTNKRNRNFEAWILAIGIMVAVVASFSTALSEGNDEISVVNAKAVNYQEPASDQEKSCQSLYDALKIN